MAVVLQAISNMSATLVSRVTSLFSSGLDISAGEKDVVSAQVTEKGAEVEASKQPDIEYHPNEKKWKARTAQRLAEVPSLPQTPLPKGFPKKLDSPLVWEGKDWKDPEEWEFELSVEQLKEIDDAVKYFNSTYLPCSDRLFSNLTSTRPWQTVWIYLSRDISSPHPGINLA